MKNIFLTVLFLLSVSYSYSQNYSTYSTNQYGQNTKSGEIKQNSYGGQDIYSTNQYGQKTKTGELRKNTSGGYDVYSVNKYGQKTKTGTVKKKCCN